MFFFCWNHTLFAPTRFLVVTSGSTRICVEWPWFDEISRGKESGIFWASMVNFRSCLRSPLPQVTRGYIPLFPSPFSTNPRCVLWRTTFAHGGRLVVEVVCIQGKSALLQEQLLHHGEHPFYYGGFICIVQTILFLTGKVRCTTGNSFCIAGDIFCIMESNHCIAGNSFAPRGTSIVLQGTIIVLRRTSVVAWP